MRSHKAILQLVLGMMLAMLGTAHARTNLEPNDNYSTLVLSYQSSTFATPICISTDCHTGVAGPAVIYSQQVIPNLALGLAGSYLQSKGQNSSINATNASAFAEVVLGLGPRLDVGTSLAYLTSSLELCNSVTSVCDTAHDSGTDLGVFGKVFLTETRSVSLMLSYHALALKQSTDQSVIGLSLVTIIAKHHRLALAVDRVRDSGGSTVSDGASFGYSYLVY
jgi:hypothetical protein